MTALNGSSVISLSDKADPLWPETSQPLSESTESLRQQGLIRAHGIIPISLNERLKVIARQQGRTADMLIGELIIRSADEVERLELEQEASRLRERLGDDWLQKLSRVNPSDI
jgi:predicted DNA-binding protein